VYVLIHISTIVILNPFCSVMLSSPECSPKKKVKRAAPGSPEFKSLTPVSIAPGLKPKGMIGNILSFGSTEDVRYANPFWMMIWI
jgi:hypothetical protein